MALTTLPPALALARSARVVLSAPRAVPEELRAALLFAMTVGIALALAALSLEVRAARRDRTRGTALAPPGRWLLLSVAGWLGAILTQDDAYEPWRVDAALATVLIAHSALVIVEPALARRLTPRARRLAWILGLQAAAAIVLAELGLRLASRASGMQLLQSEMHVAADVVAQAHLEPYARYGVGTLNARGFNDEEFGPRTPGRSRVLAIGDSFSTGMVPGTHHYTTVAERELGDVEILNVGVPRVGPFEYLHLYRSECAALEPDLVVVTFFTGNDVLDARLRLEGHSTLGRWFDRRYCLVSEVPRRLLRLRGQAASVPGPLVSALEPLTFERAEELLPHLSDPLLEEPTFGEESFRRIEVQRAQFHERIASHAYAEALAPLLELRELARPVPMAILLLPDEYQVEDEVWRDVCADLGRVPEGRDRAQPELSRLCAEAGLPCSDTLPALRAVEPLPDGRRHLYHLRDTHFNARGNQIVGLELARLVREQLARAPGTRR